MSIEVTDLTSSSTHICALSHSFLLRSRLSGFSLFQGILSDSIDIYWIWIYGDKINTYKHRKVKQKVIWNFVLIFIFFCILFRHFNFR